MMTSENNGAALVARRGVAGALALVAGLVAALLLAASSSHAAHRVCAYAAGLPAQCYTVTGNGPWDHQGSES